MRLGKKKNERVRTQSETKKDRREREQMAESESMRREERKTKR